MGEQPATGSKSTIRDNLVSAGIILKQYAPGQHSGLTCPKCNGGPSAEKSFSLHISDDSQSATWICHRGTCGWAGGCNVSGQTSTAGGSIILGWLYSRFLPEIILHMIVDAYIRNQLCLLSGIGGMVRERKVEAAKRPDCSRLQPLSREVVEYFAQRGISRATLERNGVQQEYSSKHNTNAIAFPYYRDGEIINIKYRTLDKKFWQASIFTPIVHPTASNIWSHNMS